MIQSLQRATMLTALVLLAGCGNDGAGVPAAPPPPEVGVLSIEPRELQLHVELPGRTSAYLVAEVRPQVSGIIRERRFTEGAEVDRGAPLYVIDPPRRPSRRPRLPPTLRDCEPSAFARWSPGTP